MLPPIFRFIKQDDRKNENSDIKCYSLIIYMYCFIKEPFEIYFQKWAAQMLFWFPWVVYYAHFCFSRNSINRLLTVANWFLKIFSRLRHTVVSISISRSIRYFAHFSFQKSQLIHCTTIDSSYLTFLNLRHTVVSLSISRSRRGYLPHHHCPSSMTGNWYIVAPKETIKELQRAMVTF